MGVLELIGLLVAGYTALRLAFYLSKFVRSPVNPKRLGNWALVTGATDGIGKGFAKELASRGINVILVSRTLSKLQDVAGEIEEKYKVKTLVIPVDFTEPDVVFDKITEGIKDVEDQIGVLINNVGMSYDHPEFFLDIENGGDVTRNLISCNISSVINMTRAVLPKMVARKAGAVINLSSLSALHSTPLLSVYSASKAFVVNFSKDLQVEYSGQGIVVQALAPGFVVSNMSKMKKASFFVPSPETYARSALSTLGLETVSTGYFPHDLMIFGLNALGYLGIQGPMVFSELSKTRKRALKKKQKTN